MEQRLSIPAEMRRFAGLEGALIAFRNGVREVIGANLVAIYVTGSLLMGDFEEASSDVDFLVVTQQPLSTEDVERVALAHARLADESDWGGRLEGGYAAQSALRSWGIEGRIVAIEPGIAMPVIGPSDYSADNMLAIRDHSLTLHGPDPRDVLPPVSRDVLTAALHEYLGELVAAPGTSEQSATEVASWVLNIARCLYGLETGRPCTKSEAAAWLAGADPTLAPILSTALAVRRGAAEATEGDTLRTGFAVLREAIVRWRPGNR